METSKFKFCYIMRGLPGSGKSTVAKKLAGPSGKLIQIDKKVHEKIKTIVHTPESDEDREIYDIIFKEFCEELEMGTETIVIDNINLCEWEYLRFV